jgi:hypothetical protein
MCIAVAEGVHVIGVVAMVVPKWLANAVSARRFHTISLLFE